MPNYTFWYSETYTYKGWLTADNKEQAKELLSKVQDSEIEFDELPNYGNKDKNYELDIDLFSIEEIE